MDIVELIKREHARTSSLFEKLEDTSNAAVKTRERLFGQLKSGLEAHGKAVQDVVYPLLRRNDEIRDLIPDARERAEVRRHLAELERIPKEDDAFLAKTKELKKIVEQHLRKEERQIFPAIKKTFGNEETEELAKRLAAARSEQIEAQQSDADEEQQNGNGADRDADVAELRRRISAASADAGNEALRATETLAGVVEDGVRDAADAMKAYGDMGRRMAESMSAFATWPQTTSGAMRELQNVWSEWAAQAMQRNMQTMRDLSGCSSPQRFAEIQRRYMADSLNGALTQQAKLYAATRRVAEEALRPVDHLVEDAEQAARQATRGRRSAAT